MERPTLTPILIPLTDQERAVIQGELNALAQLQGQVNLRQNSLRGMADVLMVQKGIEGRVPILVSYTLTDGGLEVVNHAQPLASIPEVPMPRPNRAARRAAAKGAKAAGETPDAVV